MASSDTVPAALPTPRGDAGSAPRGERFAQATGACTFVFAAAFFAAWLTRDPSATAWVAPRMKANTSLCLMLLSAGLVLHASGPRGGRSARAGFAATALSVAVAGVTLAQYVFGFDLRIDELLARDVTAPESARFPNRMAPNAAAGFLVGGAALLLARHPRRAVALASQALCAVAIAINMVALLGYLYDATLLYQPLPYIRISPFTAGALLAIGVGTLGLRRDVGLMSLLGSTDAAGYLVRRLLAFSVAAPVILGWLWLEAQRLRLYPPSLGTAMLVITVMVTFSGVVVTLALTVDRMDARRRAVESDLRLAGELSSALARAATVQEVVEAAMRLGLPALGASCGYFLLSSEDGRLRIADARGYSEEDVRTLRSIPTDEGFPAASAQRESRPIFIESKDELLRRFPAVRFEESSARVAWAVLPVGSREKPRGVFGLGYLEAPRFDADARERMMRLTWHLGLALDRALLFESEKAAHARAEAATAAGAVGTWVWELPAGRFVADAVMARMFGVPAEEAAAGVAVERFLSAIHEEDRARARAAIERAVEQGDAYESEYRVRDAQGVVRWVSARGRVERDARGEPIGFHGALTDVTRRKEAEEQLRRAEREKEETRVLLDTLLATAPVGMAYLDDDMRYVRVNATLARAGGRAVEEHIGRRPAEVLPAALAEWVTSNVRRVIETREPLVGLEYSGDSPGAPGVSGHWLVSYYPVPGVSEGIRGVGMIVVDITELKQAQRELKTAHGQLHGALQSAEAASRTKDEFLAMLGHELRNPLSPIVTSLQLMKLRAPDTLERERAVIERQVQHMVRLVDDLLDMSRVTRGKLVLKKQRVELGEVVATAVEMASPLFEQKRQVLTSSVPQQGLAVQADVHRLAQVVSNLLTNAAKYTDPGGTIAVFALRLDDRVILTVKDQGIGISSTLLPRVFDHFVQGERTLDRSQGGLGLGLSIVRALVEMHGGSVAAYSAGVGKGSEFSVNLPLDLSTPAATPSDAGDAAKGATQSRRRSSRVLVVDDNVDAAELFADALRAEGHDVRVAHDGPSGLSVAEGFKPEVAFLDIGLPVMDGYEVARRLRQMDSGPAMVLVAVTGYGQESDRTRSLEAGFDRHLVKPVDLDQVLSIAAKPRRSMRPPPPA